LLQNPQKKILLIASDIARYGLNTSGESSQGGGAVAMVLSANPRLLQIELESGFYTEDVMDFWRPNYREEALVEGKYSCELYLKVLQKTWQQYKGLSGRQFQDHARFCYHVPMPRLVEKAHRLLLKHNGLDDVSEEASRLQVYESLIYGREVGNCYTASLYLALLSLLEQAHDDLTLQRIGLYSYGSGCVGEFFSAVVQPGYRSLLDTDYHQNLLSNRCPLTQSEYEAFYHLPSPMDGGHCVMPVHQKGHYRLSAINKHKRIYQAVEPL